MTAAPAAVEQRWKVHEFRSRGGTLAVWEHLPHAGGASPPASRTEEENDPLIFLHGFTGDHRSWESVADLLATESRLFAVDLPGHGGSDFGTGAEAHSMEKTAAALESALDALGVRRCILAGYSMGGRLALYVALTRPQYVRRLIIESASPGLPTGAERAARRAADEELAQFVLSRGMGPFVERWERVPVLAGERRLPPALRQELRAQRLSCSPAGLAASLRGMGTGSQPWLGDRLHALDLPVLLIAGGEDEKFARSARAMAAQLPRAEVRVIEGAGHNVHLERPAEFARTLAEFIAAGAGEKRTHIHARREHR